MTRPFGFEGRRRSVQAESGIQKLKEKVDTIIIIPNERLLQVSDERTSMLNAFKMADEVLLQGVQGITDLITTPGLINTDFADVKMILNERRLGADGRRLRVRRRPRGQPRRVRDLEPAARSQHRGRPRHPAERQRTVRPRAVRAERGGRDHRPGRAPDANIIFGAVIDDALGDEVRITVIAAGFDRFEGENAAARRRSTPNRRSASTTRTRSRARTRLDLGDDDFDVPEFLR